MAPQVRERLQVCPLSAQVASSAILSDLQALRMDRRVGDPARMGGIGFLWQVAGLAIRGRRRAFGGDYVRVFPSVRPEKGTLFVVADSVGADRQTSVAGRLAAEALAASYLAHPSPDPLSSLPWAFESARRRLETAFPPPVKAGVVLLAAVLRGSWLFLAHVGDCRAYLVRSGQTRLLTHDHRWVTQEVLARALSPAQAAKHPWRRVLTRWLGRGNAGEPDLCCKQVQPGDVLVLCSDGLWEAVRERFMARVVTACPPGEAVRRLVYAAMRGGEGDDIAALVIHFAPRSWAMLPLPPSSLRSGTDPVPVAFQLAGGLSLVTWLIALGLRVAATAPR